MESPKIMAAELPVLDEKLETVEWTRNQRRPTLHNAYSMPSLVSTGMRLTFITKIKIKNQPFYF